MTQYTIKALSLWVSCGGRRYAINIMVDIFETVHSLGSFLGYCWLLFIFVCSFGLEMCYKIVNMNFYEWYQYEEEEDLRNTKILNYNLINSDISIIFVHFEELSDLMRAPEKDVGLICVLLWTDATSWNPNIAVVQFADYFHRM